MSETEQDTEGVEDANVQTGVGPFDAEPLAEPGSLREKGQPEETGFSSAPPPQAQTGVPLDEDRAAGVEPGEVPEPPDAPEVATTP